MTREPPHQSTEPVTPPDSAPLKAKLVVVSGPDFGRELALTVGRYFVGKSPRCSLVLEDQAVSSTHLSLEVLAHSVRVTDNASTNGSYCDGRRFTSLELVPPALLKIGRTELQLLPADALGAPLAPSTATSFGPLVGKSLAMRQLFALLERASSSDSDVLITGETGVGKELCARALHQRSGRHDGPFEVLDFAGLPSELAESELYGHSKGAFTGAAEPRVGAFERARGGTVFLDGLAELPLELQPRLLRVLEAREVKRVGEAGYRKVDVRVISATHRDLRALVREGRFRADLMYRLGALELKVPALRERTEDLPLLVDALLAQRRQDPTVLSAATRQLLLAHDWPGNVRELRNVVDRALGLGGLDALPPGARVPPGARGPVDPDTAFGVAKGAMVDAFERDYLLALLERHQGNVSRAADAAELRRSHLQKLLKKHGLDAARFRSRPG
ncbi:MAG: sigma 54-interacting transcriptional regulator [Archangiaceae bacterium]|nr:sigma 54-interacting transcriptional regulator [Archangiaceae bacterium]